MLTELRQVIKLGDFGISKVLDGTIDMAKTVIGTPYYMSPELCENQPYGMQSDVWALGCILYEMCVLKHAFDATNICGLIFKILNGSYPPISEKYSEDLRGLVAKMLSREPKDRPTLTQILKMPLITQVMASLREDLSKGVTARTLKSPSKTSRKAATTPATKAATIVKVADVVKPAVGARAKTAASAAPANRSTAQPSRIPIPTADLVRATTAASIDRATSSKTSDPASSLPPRAGTPGLAPPPPLACGEKSAKELMEERKRSRQEAEDKRVREAYQRASLEGLKERMAAQKRKKGMFAVSVAPVTDSPMESSQEERAEAQKEELEKEKPMNDVLGEARDVVTGWEVTTQALHQTRLTEASPDREEWETQVSPQDKVEAGWEVNLPTSGDRSVSVSRGAGTSVSAVSSEELNMSMNVSSLDRTGSSLEEELPEAPPIIDGHTLPRLQGEVRRRSPENVESRAVGRDIREEVCGRRKPISAADESEGRSVDESEEMGGSGRVTQGEVQDQKLEDSKDEYDDDFDDYSSDFESDDEYCDEKVMEVMQEQESHPETAPAAHRPVSREASSMDNRRQTEYYRTKILPLRRKCEQELGVEKFEQVHEILRRRWSGECADEDEIKASLQAIVPASRMNAVFLVDQLIFCEEHEK